MGIFYQIFSHFKRRSEVGNTAQELWVHRAFYSSIRNRNLTLSLNTIRALERIPQKLTRNLKAWDFGMYIKAMFKLEGNLTEEILCKITRWLSVKGHWKCSKTMNIVLQVSPFVYLQSKLNILSESMTDIYIRSHKSLSAFKLILFKYSRICTFFCLKCCQANWRKCPVSQACYCLEDVSLVKSKKQHTPYFSYVIGEDIACILFWMSDLVEYRWGWHRTEANADGCIVW